VSEASGAEPGVLEGHGLPALEPRDVLAEEAGDRSGIRPEPDAFAEVAVAATLGREDARELARGGFAGHEAAQGPAARPCSFGLGAREDGRFGREGLDVRAQVAGKGSLGPVLEGLGAVLGLIPEPRFRPNPSARGDDVLLAADFRVDGLPYEVVVIQVADLHDGGRGRYPGGSVGAEF
jgi:hypothetical protein